MLWIAKILIAAVIMSLVVAVANYRAAARVRTD